MMEPEIVWAQPPKPLVLGEGEVHVWRADLQRPAVPLESLTGMLSSQEIERAERFRSARDKNHFIAGRGTLRLLLARYLSLPPDQISIANGPLGKPFLKQESKNAPMYFNLSHSDGVALYAFTRLGQVGIDLERIRPELATPELAGHTFSRRELEGLNQLPAEKRALGFFCCWTRKECYVKARGEGLQIPLDSFDVSVSPDGPVRLHSTDTGRWSLVSFYPEPGYVAAMATEGVAFIRHFYSESAGPQ